MNEHTFKFNLGDSSSQQMVTPKIEGKLGALLIKAEEPHYQVKIYLKDYPEAVIFEERQLTRTSVYTLIKTDAFNSNTGQYDSADSWLLNDELVIEVVGMINPEKIDLPENNLQQLPPGDSLYRSWLYRPPGVGTQEAQNLRK